MWGSVTQTKSQLGMLRSIGVACVSHYVAYMLVAITLGHNHWQFVLGNCARGQAKQWYYSGTGNHTLWKILNPTRSSISARWENINFDRRIMTSWRNDATLTAIG